MSCTAICRRMIPRHGRFCCRSGKADFSMQFMDTGGQDGIRAAGKKSDGHDQRGTGKTGISKRSHPVILSLSSLNHFFDVQEREEQMLHRLQHLPETWQEKLGDVGVTAKKERFCFYIPEQGSVYVHEHEKPDEFIRELVELVGRHGCTMQEIRELFCKHSSHVECQKIENGEFDWMFRFAEDEEDPYYYCFKDEGIHIIYHRFLPEDYREFGV